MTTDIAVPDQPSPSGSNLPARLDYAKKLAVAELLPKAFRNNPANVLIAMEFGDALGITPIQAMNDIHVIDGKPSASANVISALVRRAGHKLRVRVNDEHLVAIADLIRADDPDFTYSARWDMKKAQTAGLTGNPNWKKHPGQMLRNRAITEVCRMGAADALYGVHYTTEELEDTRSAHAAATNPVTAAEILGGEVVDEADEPGDDAVDAEVVEDTGGDPWTDETLVARPPEGAA